MIIKTKVRLFKGFMKSVIQQFFSEKLIFFNSLYQEIDLILY